jgi:4-amino-4-deoxy-L-arabinose transferase-like glycosyltransferase
LKKNAFIYPVLILGILLLGLVLRTFRFPEIPPGLNIDEAVSAYEAFSLLETGKDKWGHPWPAYFPGWGSGQNVLLAYLSTPLIQVFGLNIFSARLPLLLVSLLTLPLFYLSLRPLGRFPALAGLLMLCLVPWHFMLSRWALESNLLPFFMLLGCYALSRALLTQQKRWIVPCLLPFALALYAYGTTVMVLPVLLGLAGVFYFKQLRARWRAWLGALTLFGVAAFPFLLFFVENHLLHANLAWTDHLFFATPILPSNRLDQINAGTWVDTLYANYYFLRAGCNDYSNYNLMPGFRPLLRFLVPLAVLGGLLGGGLLLLSPKKFLADKPANTVIAVFLFWAAASFMLFVSFKLNINRFNHFYLPAIAITAWLLHLLTASLRRPALKRGGQAALVAWILLESSPGIRHYFTAYPQTNIRETFNAGLQPAFAALQKLPVNQVYLPHDLMPLSLTYIYALFYLQYPPAALQQHGDFKIENGVYRVNRFGKYAFYEAYLRPGQAYGFLVRKGQQLPDSTRAREVYFENETWQVGIVKPVAAGQE